MRACVCVVFVWDVYVRSNKRDISNLKIYNFQIFIKKHSIQVIPRSEPHTA